MRAYLLMRPGIHLCDHRARGPLPPIPDPDFRFHEYAGEGSWWRVLHDAETAFVIEAECSEDYYHAWLEPMEHSLATTDFETFIDSLIANDVLDTLEGQYATAVLDSVGTREREEILWRFQPGYQPIHYPTVVAEEEAGLYP